MFRLSDLHFGNYKKFNWVSYFMINHENQLQIDFSKETELSNTEKALIFPSIQNFQKGEASDGVHLLHCVRRYAAKKHDPDYMEAMKWFVREENQHSAYLKKYMDYYDIPVRKNSTLDRIFRNLRKLGGLKGEVIVLVTAEMIALSYYSALSECTDSPVLKRICRQMLHDELRHVVFQSCTLNKLKIHPLENLLRILLMETTVAVVWFSMADVFRSGGYTFRRLLRDSLGYLKQSIDISNT